MIDADLYPTTELIERAITEACDTIAREYDIVLDAPASRTAGPKTALITAADHDPTSADMDRATRLVALCVSVTASLKGWCRLVMEDRPVTSAKALPLGTDTPGMCAFIERHAEWLARHDAGPACAAELSEWARTVRATARPERREWLYLGACPFVLPDGDRMAACRGRVRVHVSSDGEEAGCSHCGQESPIEWWEAVLGVATRGRIVGTEELSRALRDRLHIDVPVRTLRRWAGQGRITAHAPFGPIECPDRPRRAWWFDLRLVLDEVALMDRACTLCGLSFSGRGPTCLRCLSAMHQGPIFAPEREAYPVRIAPQPEQKRAAPKRHPSEREWCALGDLPVTWCGCRAHREGA